MRKSRADKYSDKRVLVVVEPCQINADNSFKYTFYADGTYLKIDSQGQVSYREWVIENGFLRWRVIGENTWDIWINADEWVQLLEAETAVDKMLYDDEAK